MNNNIIAWAWVFHGNGARFASAVFSSKEAAEDWIFRNKVTGMLTKMPLERIAIYLSSVNCNMRQHPGAFHFMHITLK